MYVFCITVISFYSAAIFLAPRYDMQDKYPYIPIFDILDCLGHIFAFGIPVFYIIMVIIKNINNKNNIKNTLYEMAEEFTNRIII